MAKSLVDSFEVSSTYAPQSSAKLGEAVREAAAKSEAVYPVGGGTMLDYGLTPTRPGTVIDVRQMNQVIDYPARDMTITVQAGITIQHLQETLKSEGQRLPIDVPQPEKATLGGAIACNVSGPRRYGFGTLRDYVIGISVVNDEGNEVKAGGRVVKNVAGYDMCKLYTGSLGTLGIISQVTLKVRPMPETSALIAFGCDHARLGTLLDTIHRSKTRPAAVSVHNGSDGHKWSIWVGYEDNRETVSWQMMQIEQEIGEWKIAPSHRWDGDASTPMWKELEDFPLTTLSNLTFKANLLPSRVGEFCQRAEPFGVNLLAHAGNGIIIGHLPPEIEKDQAAPIIESLRALAVQAQGNLILMRCPADWKPTLKVWGRPRGDDWLMREVKSKLDPKDVFNPGRMTETVRV